MSARKVERPLPSVSEQSQTRLALPMEAISVRKGGIEFRTFQPVGLWKEVTVDLHTPIAAKKIHCTGVVVACDGNRHSGYAVSMVITNISRHSQELLNLLSASRLQ